MLALKRKGPFREYSIRTLTGNRSLVLKMLRAAKLHKRHGCCSALGTSEWSYADASGNAPFLGRPWVYGIYDCYSLFRDFYKREFNIQLADYNRGAEFEWASPEWRMFEKNVKDQGFVEVESAERKGDMLLMQLQSPFPNHTGVLTNPSRNIFYHHLLDRFSEENVYGGYWAKHTNKVLRHKELL
jgi:cell wall-associated NlpC family hydrolase